MPSDYLAVRDECYKKKQKAKGGKPLTKQEKAECKEMAVKWWVKKHGKPFPKHASFDKEAAKELRSVLMDNSFWEESGLSDSGVLWSRIHTDKEDFDAVDDVLKSAGFNDHFIKIKIKDSSLFDKFYLETTADGIVKIIGFDKESAKKEVQAYLFNRDSFDVLKSIKHLVNESSASIEKDSVQWSEAKEVEDAFDHREFLYCQGSVVENFSKDVLAKAGLDKIDRDLLPVSFKLVHANTNANKDTFLDTELDVSKATPIHKPIDWQHTDTIIGVMVDSSKVDPVASEGDESVEASHLHIDGVIYKYKFPTYAAEIEERHQKNNLFFSMEVWFDEAECSTCGAIASNRADYCEHLKARFADFSTTTRILRGLTFGGAGVVDNPADKEASSTSLGSKVINSNIKEEGNMPKTETEVVFANDADLEAYVQKRIEEITSKQAVSEKQKQLEADLTAANETIKELNAQLEAKDAAITEANSKTEALQAEFDAFKNELAKDKRLEDRVKELTDAGIKFPEDAEKRNKVHASIREMEDDAYVNYKEVILESVANKEPVADPDTSKADVQSDDEPPVDVPNTKGDPGTKFSALTNILDKTGRNQKDE